ncbi:hypothetical protein NEOLI_001807 [Neolecta irregularis DAH-3]|uniref:Uncharacterized protein n=1 Tax=Neolecta irregularis (strain DAH-3) TaxID=1198029 RepID=A0A1U7LPG8_NEOID|nr:hypothetical protein NEOLI_001807 [Neolecta irregularis DAH-3]|eukprot:OLL24544.1 hypothetical protein NEOLI_001807 [Neolecta irregularis DAH-3]
MFSLVVAALRPRILCSSIAFRQFASFRSTDRPQDEKRPSMVQRCLDRTDEPLFLDIANRVENNLPLQPLYSELCQLQERDPKDALTYEIMLMMNYQDSDFALELFEKAKHADAVSTRLTNHVITILARKNRFDEAMKFLGQATRKISPKSMEFLYKSAPSDPDILSELRKFAVKHHSNGASDSFYIAALAKADLDAARKFAMERSNPPTRVWNALFEAAGKTKDIDIVYSIRQDYPKDLPIRGATQVSLFMAVAKILPDQLFALAKGEKVSNLSENAAILFKEFEVFLQDTPLSPFQFPLVGYLYIPDWQQAIKVIEYAESTKGDVSKLYKYYFQALEQHNKLDKASEYLAKIDSLGLASSADYSRLFRAYLRNEQVEQGKLVIEEMKTKGMSISYDLVGSLLNSGVET